MILQGLNNYYQRLAEDENADVAPIGYSRQKISFCITLNSDGTLHSIDDLREKQGARSIPKSLIVLGNAKPPGSGLNPCFLWDSLAYMLGFRPEDAKPQRTLDSFEAFRRQHLEAKASIGDPEFSAVCMFLTAWSPDHAAQYSVLSELGTGFGVFRVRGMDHYVHERPKIKDWWNSRPVATEDTQQLQLGQCLVTGDTGKLARLHEPKIKGVMNAQSSGAALVSFNQDAFNSFGREQSFNSPVSESAAFQYCTALNHLLREGSPQRLQIGDATTVFWTDRPTPAENLLPWVFDTTKDAEDEATKAEVGTLLQRIRSGSYPSELGPPETPFYVLGLSPNAARISVRFWHESTLQALVEKLKLHFNDLQLAHSDRDPDFPSLWQLLRETVRESKDLPPLLGGAVMRAILAGTPYPRMLFGAVVRRIRADRQLRYLRIAMLKACLNRNHRSGIETLYKELPMSLDSARPEPAYQLGRLFAELEKTQEDALPGINDTIKDRYFGAASATPASVFPRLIRLSQHHLGKLEKGSRVFHERRIQEIAGNINDFPAHLNLRDQGLFAIGYYHQRQDIFTKKTEPETTAKEN